MEHRIWSRVLAGAFVVAGALGSGAANAAAQGGALACSAAMLSGTYGIQLQGTRAVPPALGGGTESVIGVVVRTYDGAGKFSQIDNVKGSVTGITPDRPGAGTYQVNADCSASTLFEPGPGISIVERMVIVDGGAEIRSMTLSPPESMITAVQKRISAVTVPVPAQPVIPCPGSDPFASIPGLVGECINGGWVPRAVGGGD